MMFDSLQLEDKFIKSKEEEYGYAPPLFQCFLFILI